MSQYHENNSTTRSVESTETAGRCVVTRYRVTMKSGMAELTMMYLQIERCDMPLN